MLIERFISRSTTINLEARECLYDYGFRRKLIVVDSGNPDNEEYVRQVLEKKGNHVNAWILTHPHPDHIGAFNQIWQATGNIQLMRYIRLI